MSEERRNGKKRAFGIHFDLHADPFVRKYIGKEKFDADLLDDFLARVKPDFVQCDTKGHFGYSAYPTKVGTAVEIEEGLDILRVWRELTKKHGVALYAHHSGVLDALAMQQHPEWASLDENGNIQTSKDINPPRLFASTFGPYADEQMIPHLLEIAQEYELDGCWIDGDGWSNVMDYSEHAVTAYRKAHGKNPPKSNEEGYEEYVEFIRQGYRDYLKHYVDTMHEKAPGFEMASAWAYTQNMPEKPVSGVDFLSGDFLGLDSINTGRFTGRCLASHGKPWDLMAWGGLPSAKAFTFDQPFCHVKEPIQLCQEAALTLALGGGFQWCNLQMNGSIQRYQAERTEKVANFYRAREPFCFEARPVHQAAVIFSAASAYSTNKSIFDASGKPTNEVYGTLQAVLDNLYSTEILMTYQAMERDLSEYGMIVVPEAPALEEELKQKLIEYAKNGGSLVVVGPTNAERFAQELGISVQKGEEEEQFIHMEEENAFYASTWSKLARIQPVREDVKTFYPYYTYAQPCQYTPSRDDDVSEVGASVTSCSKGKIAGLYFELVHYIKARSTALRRVVGKILNEVYPEPAVKIKGTHLVDVSLMTKDGKLCLNLTNMGGRACSGVDMTFDEIPPLCDLEVELRVEKAPVRVWREPEHEEVAYTYENGVIRFKVERLDIHSVFVVE